MCLNTFKVENQYSWAVVLNQFWFKSSSKYFMYFMIHFLTWIKYQVPVKWSSSPGTWARPSGWEPLLFFNLENQSHFAKTRLVTLANDVTRTYTFALSTFLFIDKMWFFLTEIFCVKDSTSSIYWRHARVIAPGEGIKFFCDFDTTLNVIKHLDAYLYGQLCQVKGVKRLKRI